MKSQVICHDKNNSQIPVSPDKLVFRPSAYGLLIKDDKILLSKQWDGYDFPGGGVEIDESIEETVVREFWEETGLKVKPLYPFYVMTSFFKPQVYDQLERHWNCQLIYFLVEAVGGEISINNLEEYEKGYTYLPEWISLDDLAGRKFYNNLREKSLDLIQRAREIKAKFPAGFII